MALAEDIICSVICRLTALQQMLVNGGCCCEDRHYPGLLLGLSGLKFEKFLEGGLPFFRHCLLNSIKLQVHSVNLILFLPLWLH